LVVTTGIGQVPANRFAKLALPLLSDPDIRETPVNVAVWSGSAGRSGDEAVVRVIGRECRVSNELALRAPFETCAATSQPER